MLTNPCLNLSLVSFKQTALDMFAFNFLNANGDLFDILKVVEPSRMVDWKKLTAKQAEMFFYTSGHCSALIKVSLF